MVTVDLFPSLDGLELSNLERVQAEFKLGGNTVDTRCASVAAMLGVPESDMVKLVMSYLGKVANDGNKWSNREDCESIIWRKLIASKGKIQGEWGMVAQAVRWAFQSWWESYKAARNINELTAISLERAKYHDDDENGILDIPSTVEFTGIIEANIDVERIRQSLPEPLRQVLQKRLTDTPLTDAERKRWARFIDRKENVSTLLGLMNGSHTGKAIWKTGRGKAKNPSE